jgi:hypothetical protein
MPWGPPSAARYPGRRFDRQGSFSRISLEGSRQQALETGYRTGTLWKWERLLPVQDRRHQGALVIALERLLSRQHLVKQHAEGPEVGTRGGRQALEQFRCHVVQRTQRLARAREAHVARLGQPEVYQPRRAPLVQHDVGRLDIPMKDPVRVGFRERFG